MHLSHFVAQKSYEKVEYTLRRHWLTFLPVLVTLLVMFAVPIVVLFIFQNLFPDFLTGPITYPLTILFGSIYFLFALMFFYIQFIDYYLDMWIITNDRLIDIEQKGLFSRSITELELFRIQDVTSNTEGLWGTLLHYGDVSIATASNTSSIILHKVPRPDFIRGELIRLAEGDRVFHLGTQGLSDTLSPDIK